MPFFKRSGNSRANGAMKNRPAFGMKYPGLVNSFSHRIANWYTIQRRANKPQIIEEIIEVIKRNGISIVDIGGQDYARSLQMDNEGNIYVAGYATISGNIDFAIIKLDSSGDLVTDFGSDGIALVDITGNDSRGYSLQLDNEGNIYVAGDSNANGTVDFTVIKLKPDGSLADDFGKIV